MNYIGSKHKLFDFIRQSVYAVVGTELSSLVFCDLFAGTGVVGRNFKNEVKQIISNDLEYYSYVLNRNYISNNEFFDFQHWIDRLNQIPGVEGFIFNEYTAEGPAQRNYFSTTNGKKIDAIRLAIRNWKEQGKISENQYYFLLASLLESADQVANTASVYSAYLKRLKKSAQKELIIKPALYERSAAKHQIPPTTYVSMDLITIYSIPLHSTTNLFHREKQVYELITDPDTVIKLRYWQLLKI